MLLIVSWMLRRSSALSSREREKAMINNIQIRFLVYTATDSTSHSGARVSTLCKSMSRHPC